MGGLSYHMERPPTADEYNVPDTDTAGMSNADALLTYIPNKEAGLGFLGRCYVGNRSIGYGL